MFQCLIFFIKLPVMEYGGTHFFLGFCTIFVIVLSLKKLCIFSAVF